jgi:hypothetical protein
MKKLLFILSIAVFLGSCLGEFNNVDYTITNDSSKNITFTFNDITKTLAKDTSIVYTLSSEEGRFAPEEIKYSGHKKSVNLETLNKGTAGIFYTFTDNTPLTLNVENNSLVSVTIKADDLIDAGADTSAGAYDGKGFTLKVNKNSEEKALIYTSAPEFSVKDARTLEQVTAEYLLYPYPIEFDWELIDDNTINLTIK